MAIKKIFIKTYYPRKTGFYSDNKYNIQNSNAKKVDCLDRHFEITPLVRIQNEKS